MSTLYFVPMQGENACMKAVVSVDGRITIPKAIRRRLGIVPGTVLAFSEEEGRLVAVRESREDAFVRWRGKGRLPNNLTVDEYLGSARGSRT
jgi:AbrB family looped-hinge helix DNA binding protein